MDYFLFFIYRGMVVMKACASAEAGAGSVVDWG